VIAKRAAGSLVLLQDAADLPVHTCRIDTLPRTSQARSQALERFFDPLAELVVHGPLFAAPIGGTAQDHGLLGLGVAREFDLDAFMDRAPSVRGSERGAELLQLRLRRADDVAAASAS
jgi:hypothetical protein